MYAHMDGAPMPGKIDVVYSASRAAYWTGQGWGQLDHAAVFHSDETLELTALAFDAQRIALRDAFQQS